MGSFLWSLMKSPNSLLTWTWSRIRIIYFPHRDVFVKVACHMPEEACRETGHIKKDIFRKLLSGLWSRATSSKGRWSMWIITKMPLPIFTESLFKSATKGKKFAITFRSPSYRITEISNHTRDVLRRDAGYLQQQRASQIAMNRGKRQASWAWISTRLWTSNSVSQQVSALINITATTISSIKKTAGRWSGRKCSEVRIWVRSSPRSARNTSSWRWRHIPSQPG